MKAANVVRIAESDKSGCFVVGKCDSVEFFCSLLSYLREKTAFQKSGPLLKGLVSRFAPQSALLAPSSATAAAFNSLNSSPTPQNAALRTKCV